MKKENQKIHPGNIIITVIAVILILSGVFYFIQYWGFSRHYEETNDAQVDSYINPVSARAGGYIEQVKFDEHQLVKQGDTLVILDDREYKAQLKAAEAAMDDAQAQLNVLSAGIHSSELGTDVNRDQIKGARARYVQQQQDIRRYKNLVKEEAATGADLEQVQARYDVAASDYSAAQNGLKTNRQGLVNLKHISHFLKPILNVNRPPLTWPDLTCLIPLSGHPIPEDWGEKIYLKASRFSRVNRWSASSMKTKNGSLPIIKKPRWRECM